MSTARFGEAANWYGVAWLAAALGLVLGGMWMVPQLVILVPWRIETHMARVLDTQSLGTLCDVGDAPAYQDLVALVHRLYPQSDREEHAPVSVHIVHSDAINAFASLGGQIYILTGLLEAAPNADALAGVLAHELEHVSQRHMLRHLFDDMATSAIFSLLLGDDSALNAAAQSADYWSSLHFTRRQEMQADRGAIERLRRASIGTSGLVQFFEALGDGPQMPAWASDHPGFDSRIKALRAQPDYQASPALSWSRWQAVKALCKKDKQTTTQQPETP